MPGRVALIVLDGFGIRDASEGNAIRLAAAPTLARLFSAYPHAALATSGPAVGLPPGQMGNSEVGHMTIGGGRVFYQMLTRIDLAIEDGSFLKNRVLVEAARQAKAGGRRLHLIGLVSDGGVHSHVGHLEALLDLAKRAGLVGSEVVIHALTDGRDTSPTSGAHHVARIEDKARALGVGVVATVGGRYYGMDRDKRWDRTAKAWNAIVRGEGPQAASATKAIEASYAAGVTDEFIVPTVLSPALHVADGDSIVFFNFRPDRARQLTRAFTEPRFHEFPAEPRPRVHYVSMTEYDATFRVPFAFGTQSAKDTLGEVVSRAGLRQLRVAETEKYAHVTYFLNGGEETVYPGEERFLVPSPKVATYDLAPSMSAEGVTERIVLGMSEGFALIVANFANCDMVGHSGNLDATIRAVEAVDASLARILEAAERHSFDLIVTADHGNAEEMRTPEGKPQTAHTTLPVPIAWVPAPAFARSASAGASESASMAATLRDGTLADVAPTVLDLLGLPIPKAMTGTSLIASKDRRA